MNLVALVPGVFPQGGTEGSSAGNFAGATNQEGSGEGSRTIVKKAAMRIALDGEDAEIEPYQPMLQATDRSQNSTV